MSETREGPIWEVPESYKLDPGRSMPEQRAAEHEPVASLSPQRQQDEQDQQEQQEDESGKVKRGKARRG